MMRLFITLFLSLFFVEAVFSEQMYWPIANGSWVSYYRTDWYWYRIYNWCGAPIAFPENYSSDFYNSTSSNVRPSCIRIHRVVNPAFWTTTACPLGSRVMYDGDWWNRIPSAQYQAVWWTSGEMRCDFLP